MDLSELRSENQLRTRLPNRKQSTIDTSKFTKLVTLNRALGVVQGSSVNQFIEIVQHTQRTSL